jgi:prephenate dehydratase
LSEPAATSVDSLPVVAHSRCGYLGPAGTFSEAAARTLPLADGGELVPYPTVEDALDGVRRGEVEAGVVPLENSVEGSVTTTLDELANGDALLIGAEMVLPVSFAVLARAGTTLESAKTVTTIPHAEAQVRRWLRTNVPGASFIPAASTADGASAVAAGHADLAIAAPLAAEHYGLQTLAADVHDTDGAQTRFVLVSAPGATLPPPTGADRTTIAAFISDDHAGALLEILTEFAVRGVNLTRIESRPTGDGIGRYFFSIDCEGHVADARVGEALSALRRVCLNVRFLGSYPRADGTTTAIRRGTADRDFSDAESWLARLRAGDVD